VKSDLQGGQMTRKLYTLVAVAAASGALIAGCGGGSTPAKTTPAKTTPAKTTPAPTTPAPTPTASTTPSSIPSAEIKVAAKACLAEISHLPSTFGAAAKADATNVCNDLASGNLAAARSDADKYCGALIAALPSSYKPEAEAACSSVKKDF